MFRACLGFHSPPQTCSFGSILRLGKGHSTRHREAATKCTSPFGSSIRPKIAAFPSGSENPNKRLVPPGDQRGMRPRPPRSFAQLIQAIAALLAAGQVLTDLPLCRWVLRPGYPIPEIQQFLIFRMAKATHDLPSDPKDDISRYDGDDHDVHTPPNPYTRPSVEYPLPPQLYPPKELTH